MLEPLPKGYPRKGTIFEEFLESLSNRLGTDSKKRIVYQGHLEDMKEKYGPLIESRKDLLIPAIEKGQLEIYLNFCVFSQIRDCTFEKLFSNQLF